MTWFRVGGAGIPATLKNAMNAVFNKKFGTSGQNYPPKQWPDDVNLLGPLPEGTASGPIANFNDGADGVPLKNWLVTLPASLSGYSEVNAKQAKKNLLKNEKYQATSNRVNIGQTDDGFTVFLRKGTYTLSVSSSINIRAYYRGELDGSNTLIWSTYSTSGSGTFTLTEDKNVRMWVIGQDGSVSTSDVLTIQLEVGSTATSYEAYSAPTQYTASLGRTIYGGQADIVTGEGEATEAIFDLGDFTWVKDNNRTGNFYTPTLSGIALTLPLKASSDFVMDNAKNANTISDGEISSAPSYGTGRVFIKKTEWDNYTVAQVKEAVTGMKVVLTLATPETFTFTPITAETELGVNNFWAEEGDTTVVYRRDIDLALQAVSSSRGLMMASRPVTQLVGEESDPDQVNELVENDENDIPEQLSEVVENDENDIPEQLSEVVENDENDIPEQLSEVVENDETEQEGENDAR